MKIKLGPCATTKTITRINTTSSITTTQFTLQLFITLFLLLSDKVPHHYAQSHFMQIPDPLAVTEIRKYFPAPYNPLEENATVPRKHLVFTLLLPEHVGNNMNDCIMPIVRPVFELGIPQIQAMGWAHNARIDITVISRDTNCSSIHGPLGFFEIYMQWPEIHAVFGMSCNYVLAPIARYVGVWGIPAFTTSGNANGFQDKREFSTLTRMMGSQGNIFGKATKEILRTYNWRNVTLIYQNNVEGAKGNSVCYFCAMVIMDEMKDKSFSVKVGQQQIASDVWTKKYIRERLQTVMPKSRSK